VPFGPGWSAPVLAGLLLALVGVYVWSVVTPEVWSTFEDTTCPIRALIGLVLTVPTAVLGWRRPLVAGMMLIGVLHLTAGSPSGVVRRLLRQRRDAAARG
jgi:hypothetical protein